MIYSNFKNFPKKGKIMGVDWGSRRIGVAVSDPMRKFVFIRKHAANPPRHLPAANATPPRKGIGSCSSAQALADLCDDEGVVGIVLGLPLRLDGSESPTTARAREFAAELAAACRLPIVLFDESLTSFEAEETGAADIDSEAARVLLENAIAVMGRK